MVVQFYGVEILDLALDMVSLISARYPQAGRHETRAQICMSPAQKQ